LRARGAAICLDFDDGKPVANKWDKIGIDPIRAPS
jgi:hypothetical protein